MRTVYDTFTHLRLGGIGAVYHMTHIICCLGQLLSGRTLECLHYSMRKVPDCVCCPRMFCLEQRRLLNFTVKMS